MKKYSLSLENCPQNRKPTLLSSLADAFFFKSRKNAEMLAEITLKIYIRKAQGKV